MVSYPGKSLMSEEHKTRFRRAEEALRFYFRVREMLYMGRARRLSAEELPVVACIPAVNAIDDFRSIGWCMRSLDEIALWLLSEIYGPTCFGEHRRTFSHACKAGRLEFPGRNFRLREVRMIHERALGVVKRGLREFGMIPARQALNARERPRRTGSIAERAHLHGSQANRG